MTFVLRKEKREPRPKPNFFNNLAQLFLKCGAPISSHAQGLCKKILLSLLPTNGILTRYGTGMSVLG